MHRKLKSLGSIKDWNHPKYIWELEVLEILTNNFKKIVFDSSANYANACWYQLNKTITVDGNHHPINLRAKTGPFYCTSNNSVNVYFFSPDSKDIVVSGTQTSKIAWSYNSIPWPEPKKRTLKVKYNWYSSITMLTNHKWFWGFHIYVPLKNLEIICLHPHKVSN